MTLRAPLFLYKVLPLHLLPPGVLFVYLCVYFCICWCVRLGEAERVFLLSPEKQQTGVEWLSVCCLVYLDSVYACKCDQV